MLPDYTNCITNIIASLEAHYGLPPKQATHPVLDALLAKKPYRNIVLLLYDGLSIATLQEALGEDAFLRRHLRAALSSVFPPTTTAAVTSLKSGLNPLSHGWIGWTMHLTDIGQNVDLFTNRLQQDSRYASLDNAGMTLLPFTTFTSRLRRHAGLDALEISAHGDWVTRDRAAMYEAVIARTRQPGPHLIYAYDGNPDHLMHDMGTRHKDVLALVRTIDQEAAAFAASLPEDSLLLITADHGLVDAEYVALSDYPQILDCMMRPFTVEGRTAAFFIRPGMHDQFREAFTAALSDRFCLMTSNEFINSGLLGPGKEHPRLRGMLGDFIALALGNACLCMQPDHASLIGVHAGRTQREMEVPLIVAKS
ncbi:MAG: hypothetical protein GXZ04_04260 [Clostridiales bacterium]|nr:hypothetical protein [Clostridiales bacterium]